MVAPTPPPRQQPPPPSRWTASEPPPTTIDPRPALAAAAYHAQRRAERRKRWIQGSTIVAIVGLLLFAGLAWLNRGDAASSAKPLVETAIPSQLSMQPAEQVDRLAHSLWQAEYRMEVENQYPEGLSEAAWLRLATLGINPIDEQLDKTSEISWKLCNGDTGPPRAMLGLDRRSTPDPSRQILDCYAVWDRHARGCLPGTVVGAGFEVLTACHEKYLAEATSELGFAGEASRLVEGWEVSGLLAVDDDRPWCRAVITAEWVGE